MSDSLIIYTDSSRINDKIGASAVSLYTNEERSAYLGPDNRYTVYIGELYGIYMALELAITTEHQHLTVLIFTDNQAAIRSTHEPESQSEQYLIRRILTLYQQLSEVGVKVKIH